MKRLILAAAAVTAVAISATPAIADVPSGNGLDVVENTVVPLVCTGDSGAPQTTTKVLVTRGAGATGWRAEPQTQHHVLSYFSIAVYFDGVQISLDEKSWGNKTGIAPLSCSQTIPLDALTTVVVRGTIHPLPGGGS